MSTTSELTYDVPAVNCSHCVSAITDEVEQVDGVDAVEVSLEQKRVTVRGTDLADGAVRSALDRAGYDVAR